MAETPLIKPRIRLKVRAKFRKSGIMRGPRNWNSWLWTDQTAQPGGMSEPRTSNKQTGNIRAVGQRPAKLLAVKVRVLKKKSAALAIPPKVFASAFGPGSSTPGVKSFSKFDSQQL